MVDLRSRLAAEVLGTALLLVIVIGSGIIAERPAGGNVAVALLASTAATVGGPYILIEMFGPISGAHFNPAVRVVMTAHAELPSSALAPYITTQLMGAILGVWLAYATFDTTTLQFSTKMRGGPGQWIAKAVATTGLLLVILCAPNGRASSMVAAYIGAACWFMASTSPTNSAVALGRMLSNSLAGTAPSSVSSFVLAEYVGVVPGLMLHRMLEPCLTHRGHPSVIEPSGEHPAGRPLQ